VLAGFFGDPDAVMTTTTTMITMARPPPMIPRRFGPRRANTFDELGL
jgi:hypothetical protein